MSSSVSQPPPSATNPTLSKSEKRTLAAMCALMIPPSDEYKVPGADDPLIQADIARSLGRDADAVHEALALLNRLAGGDFAALPRPKQEEAATTFRAEGGMPLTLLQRLVLQCYYRDDRVMISLGMEPRPPFPKGHVVEQGDWSLLDPVRKRGKIWRDA